MSLQRKTVLILTAAIPWLLVTAAQQASEFNPQPEPPARAQETLSAPDAPKAAYPARMPKPSIPVMTGDHMPSIPVMTGDHKPSIPADDMEEMQLRSGQRPGGMVDRDNAAGATSPGMQDVQAGRKPRPDLYPAAFEATPEIIDGQKRWYFVWTVRNQGKAVAPPSKLHVICQTETGGNCVSGIAGTYNIPQLWPGRDDPSGVYKAWNHVPVVLPPGAKLRFKATIDTGSSPDNPANNTVVREFVADATPMFPPDAARSFNFSVTSPKEGEHYTLAPLLKFQVPERVAVQYRVNVCNIPGQSHCNQYERTIPASALQCSAGNSYCRFEGAFDLQMPADRTYMLIIQPLPLAYDPIVVNFSVGGMAGTLDREKVQQPVFGARARQFAGDAAKAPATPPTVTPGRAAMPTTKPLSGAPPVMKPPAVSGTPAPAMPRPEAGAGYGIAEDKRPVTAPNEAKVKKQPALAKPVIIYPRANTVFTAPFNLRILARVVPGKPATYHIRRNGTPLDENDRGLFIRLGVGEYCVSVRYRSSGPESDCVPFRVQLARQRAPVQEPRVLPPQKRTPAPVDDLIPY